MEMDWFKYDDNHPCVGCGANLGHLNGCIYDTYEQVVNSLNPPRPKRPIEEMIDDILDQFFKENKGIKKNGK